MGPAMCRPVHKLVHTVPSLLWTSGFLLEPRGIRPGRALRILALRLVFLKREMGSGAPAPKGECWGVPYLPAVKQLPLAAPMVENATKSGMTQEAG